jgi:hypothetical protein
MRTTKLASFKLTGYDWACLKALKIALRDDATGVVRRGLRALARHERVELPDPKAEHPLPETKKKPKKSPSIP